MPMSECIGWSVREKERCCSKSAEPNYRRNPTFIVRKQATIAKLQRGYTLETTRHKLATDSSQTTASQESPRMLQTHRQGAAPCSPSKPSNKPPLCIAERGRKSVILTMKVVHRSIVMRFVEENENVASYPVSPKRWVLSSSTTWAAACCSTIGFPYRVGW